MAAEDQHTPHWDGDSLANISDQRRRVPQDAMAALGQQYKAQQDAMAALGQQYKVQQDAMAAARRLWEPPQSQMVRDMLGLQHKARQEVFSAVGWKPPASVLGIVNQAALGQQYKVQQDAMAAARRLWEPPQSQMVRDMLGLQHKAFVTLATSPVRQEVREYIRGGHRASGLSARDLGVAAALPQQAEASSNRVSGEPGRSDLLREIDRREDVLAQFEEEFAALGAWEDDQGGLTREQRCRAARVVGVVVFCWAVQELLALRGVVSDQLSSLAIDITGLSVVGLARKATTWTQQVLDYLYPDLDEPENPGDTSP